MENFQALFFFLSLDHNRTTLEIDKPFYMFTIHIRPRIKRTCKCLPEDIATHIKEQLAETNDIIGHAAMNSITLKIPPKDHHYWSPELHLHLRREEEDELTEVSGFVGPKSSIWTMFMFLYIGLGTTALFTGMYAMTQQSLDIETTGGYMISIISLILIGVVFIATQIGQKIALNQTHQLIAFMEGAFRCLD